MIIGLCGYKGSGKSTFASYLAKHLDDVGRFSIAHPLKEAAFELGWDGEKDDKGRVLLQDLGDAGRKYNKYIFLDALWNKIKELQGKFEYFIIDDIRLPMEIQYLRDTEFTLVTAKVTRPIEQVDPHPTEQDIKEFDYKVCNNGTLSDLEKVALTFIKEKIYVPKD